MKKNTYSIPIALIVVAVFFTSLAGCSLHNDPNQDTTQMITDLTVTEPMSAPVRKSEEEPLTDWGKAYKIIIEITLKESKEKYPNESNYGGYGLYDFDSDGIPELFLSVYGSASVDYCIHIYDFNGEEAVFIDCIESAHSWVYGTNIDNSFLTECCWMGESVWNTYELKNGEFVSQELASYYPDGFGDSIEPQENPLPGMGYEIEEIKYYFLDDLSGINNLS